MNANTHGIDRLISEAADLIDAGVAVGLVDINAGPCSVGAITDKGVFETLVQFSPDEELVIPLTAESGLVALAVDPDSGGLESVRPLLDKGEIPTQTPIVNTADGKSYLLFRFTGSRTKGNVPLGPGLDLISVQGFIVVPPRYASDSAEGRWKGGYHPAEMAVAEFPERLAALL